MELMAIIGSVGACLYLLGRALYNRRQPPVDAYRRDEEKWLEEHTDPVFGRPLDESYHHAMRHTPEGMLYRIYDYQAPFRHCSTGSLRVEMDQFPAVKQKELFLWLENKMELITKLVPELLLASSEEDIPAGGSFYGVLAPESAASAFNPRYIHALTLRGTNPVKWTIHFNATIDQDVAGDIEGEDEVVRRAYLYM